MPPRALPKEYESVHVSTAEHVLNSLWQCARQSGFGGRIEEITPGHYVIFTARRAWTARLTGNRRLLVPSIRQVKAYYGGDFTTAIAAAVRQFGGIPEAEARKVLEAWESRPMPEIGEAIARDDTEALRMALDENLDGVDALRRANRLRGGQVLGPRQREHLAALLVQLRRADALAELDARRAD